MVLTVHLSLHSHGAVGLVPVQSLQCMAWGGWWGRDQQHASLSLVDL